VTVCITGGSGFIGWYVCRALAADGVALRILDLVPPGDDLPPHDFIRGDLRDPAAVRAALAGCDAVINLAAAHHDFGIADETYFDVNERGAKVLCDVMDELGVRRCCFYSTVAVYGDTPPPLTESTPPAPNSPYGASKLAGEKVFEGWTQQGDGRRCLVIRPTVTFGPRNFANMYSLIRQIHSGKFLRVGPGTNIKSLAFIDNIVAATLFLWNRPDAPPFDVFNYIDKPDLSSREISETVYEALGRRVPRVAIPMWFARLAVLPFDIVIALTGKNIPVSGARVKKLFSTQTKFEADKVKASGYAAAVPLREGIRRMVEWYLATGKDQSADWHLPPAEADVVQAE
jgi:nucleoside-diphosphate-sugar epimerase